MPDQDWERHWSAMSLGIVTIATAAIGGALFAIDISKIVTSMATYILVIIAIGIYLWVLLLGGRAIFTTSEELSVQGTSKRDLTRMLYGWFFLELFAIAGLLVSQAYASFLRSVITVL